MLWLTIKKMWFGVHILTCVVLIMILVSTTTEQTCALLNTIGITYPNGDITLKEGDNLTIYCTLYNKSMEYPNNINSSLLEFTVGEESLPSEMYDIVNSSTIRLHIENMTESFKVYNCKAKDINQMVCVNNVYVGTPPKPVLNFTCISYNWDNVVCTWRQPLNYVKTKYHLTYQLAGRASKGTYFSCHNNESEHIGNDLYQCGWNISTKPQYRRGFEKINFTMIGRNKFGTIITAYPFKTFENVLINPPYNLTCISKTTNSIYISCQMQGSIVNFPKGLKYIIQYQSQHDNNIWQNKYIEEKNKSSYDVFTYNLTNLNYSHALYDIRVRVASLLSTSESMWSNITSITVRTESTIPSCPPKVDIGSFEVVPVVGGRDVYLYWQKIPDYLQNGEDFVYTIDVKENNKLNATIKPNETTSAYAKFTGLQLEKYVFNIYSANKVGKSVNHSILVVPSIYDSIAEPTSFTKIAFDNHTYELSWEEPQQRLNETITSYTIFWCRFDKDRPYQCEGYLDWERVSPNITMLNKTVDSNNIYQFAIAANTETSSSGMVWASCTIIYNRFVSKIKHLWVNKIGSTFIEMGWKLDCLDRIGIITGFRIYYCPIISPLNRSCNDSVLHNVTVEGDLNTMTGEVKNLRPYTTYMLYVSVLTKFGEGLMSDSKYNTTYEAAPDVIDHIEITGYTNTTISLKWSRPKNLNGMFLNYIIRYNKEELEIKNVTTLLYTLKNLTSFTTYDISVTGCTRICSNSSEVKTVTTLIGYPSIIDEPKINYMNESQLQLYWAKPLHPGGHNLYQVRMNNSDENYVESHNTTELQIELPIPSCEDKYGSEHIYNVRAINEAEDGTLLVGPWSPSKKFPCSNLKTRYTILYTIIGLVAIVLIVVFIAIGKKGWIRYQEMKNVQVTLPPGLTHTIGSKESDYVLTQRPVVSTGLQTSNVKPMKEILPNETLNSIASDEQLLLEKKKSANLGELDSTLISGESSGCSSGNESISSSIASVPISNVACNVSDSGTEHALSADTASLESGSLRWRNVANKPHSSELTSNVRTDSTSRLPSLVGQSVWTKPYVTIPGQDKVDNFSGAWSKPTIGSSGYCQVGMDPLPVTTTQSTQSVSPGYVQVPMLSSSDSKTTLSSRPYVPHSKKPADKYILTKPAFSSVQVLDDENTSISQSDSDSSVNESPNIQTTSFKYSPIGTPMKVCDLINIKQNEVDETSKEVCKSEKLYSDHSCISPYVKIGTDDTENKSSNVTPYVKVGCEEIKSVLPISTKSTDIGISKKNPSPSSYVTLPQAVRQTSQKSQNSAADARPLLPSPPAAYSRIGILEPSNISNPPSRSLPEYVQWKNSDLISTEPTTVKFDSDKLVPEKSAKSKTGYGVHRQFDCKLLKED